VGVDVVTGTLSCSSCTIASGASTCNSTVNWTVPIPQGNSAITSNYPSDNTILGSYSSSTLSGNLSVPVTYSSRNLYLYNSALQLVSCTPSATCDTANGYSWNGSKCISGISKPTISSPTATCTSATAAILGATITSAGGAPSVTHGFCFTTVANVSSIQNSANCTSDSTPVNTGAITKNYTGLTSGTNYVFEGYATNSAGTSYTTTSGITCTTAPVSSPDLTVGSVTPTTATDGTAQTYSATISNIGTGAANIGFSNIFQTATAWNGTTATGVANYSASSGTAVGPGGTQGVSVSATFSAGTYYARFCADASTGAYPANGNVSESNEGNNCGPWTAITVTTPSGGGVVTGTLTAPPSCVIPTGSSGCYVNLNWNTTF
jgi:hypothetical protein